ncbi:MAG: hypothetical protein ACKVP7_17700 [Hyphomicrobiaceae bacterium]
MQHRPLSELFLIEQNPVDAIPRDAVKSIIIAALESRATKLDRAKALLEVAPPQPLTTGLQPRLFDILAAEDLRLAVDVILDTYERGTLVAYYLPRCIATLTDPEQLRRVVSVLAATARNDFDPELLEDVNGTLNLTQACRKWQLEPDPPSPCGIAPARGVDAAQTFSSFVVLAFVLLAVMAARPAFGRARMPARRLSLSR